MNKKTFFGILLAVVFAAVQVNAQDLDHYKKIVKELSSSKYQGRGYAKDGANKAGKYLEKEFTKAGVDEVICQPFTLDINTFPGKMKMWVDGKKQTPGVDFTVREFNPSIKGEFGLYYIDTANYNSEKILPTWRSPRTKTSSWSATSCSATSTGKTSSACKARTSLPWPASSSPGRNR